jgi:hypothetical protein
MKNISIKQTEKETIIKISAKVDNKTISQIIEYLKKIFS